MTSIGSNAFNSCSGLTSITIPNSVTSIGEFAFASCGRLSRVDINGLDSWCTISFENEESNPLCFADSLCLNGNLVKKLIIPNGVESIGQYAFYDYSVVDSIMIPNSVKSIGNCTFYSCTNLSDIVIADGENSLSFSNKKPFWGCGLKSLYLGRNVNQNTNFSDITTLEKIMIGDKVSSIAEGMFKGCFALADIYCLNSRPCRLADAFDGEHYLNTTVYVPTGSLSAYQAADGWRSFWNVVESDATAIKGIHVGDKLNGAKVKAIYSLDGKRVSTAKPNQMYIIEYTDGRKAKAIVKK